MPFTNQDIILGIICLCSAGLFIFLGNDKLFKFFFGVILGFLLFFIANLEVKILTMAGSSIASNVFENFILKNKDFILGFSTCMIPIFGLFLALNDNISIRVRGGIYVSLFLGGLLPLFVLGLMIYVLTYSALPLGFLTDILSLFSGSIIFDFLKNNLHLVLYFLLFLVFYKIVLTFFFAFFAKVFEMISQFLSSIFAGKDEKEEHHGSHHISHHGAHQDDEDDHHDTHSKAHGGGHGGHH